MKMCNINAEASSSEPVKKKAEPAKPVVAAPAAPVAQPQQEVNVINQFNNMEGLDNTDFGMTFGEIGGDNVLESFDFDSFLQDQGGEHEFLDGSMAFANFDGVEAGTGDP